VGRRIQDRQAALLAICADHHFEHVGEIAALQRGGDAHRLLEGRVNAGGEGVRFGGWHGVLWTAVVIFYSERMNTLLQRKTGI